MTKRAAAPIDKALEYADLLADLMCAQADYFTSSHVKRYRRRHGADGRTRMLRLAKLMAAIERGAGLTPGSINAAYFYEPPEDGC